MDRCLTPQHSPKRWNIARGAPSASRAGPCAPCLREDCGKGANGSVPCRGLHVYWMCCAARMPRVRPVTFGSLVGGMQWQTHHSWGSSWAPNRTFRPWRPASSSSRSLAFPTSSSSPRHTAPPPRCVSGRPPQPSVASGSSSPRLARPPIWAASLPRTPRCPSSGFP